ncbi:GAP family protein [Microbacterium murale]|uniref:GAP family protein n=1 Tax=Microbacterium murale TaxID=1081040 RepID=A0ABQ1REL2_9MICO|nr:GAP family protein [Microbacterium murale]GGD65415.1 hypothetical protein GCM10007269_05810 [Microbacterium murale]
MGTVIGELLPFALGIAISPLPIIVVILTLLSPKARTSSVGFLSGWLVGILVVIVTLTALSTFLPAHNASGPSIWEGVIKLVLGALLLFLAGRQWRKRPANGEIPPLPGWMQKVDGLGFGGALRLGLFLSVVNPKNIIFSTTVAVDLGTSGLALDGIVVGIVLFTSIAASTVLVPVIAYLVAASRLRAPLESLHAWLVRENHTIMCVLFLVLGFSAIGNGLAAMWP